LQTVLAADVRLVGGQLATRCKQTQMSKSFDRNTNAQSFKQGRTRFKNILSGTVPNKGRSYKWRLSVKDDDDDDDDNNNRIQVTSV
jgi:hypothetical protein